MTKKIQKSNVQDIYELNDIQKGMLFHYLKAQDENLYNIQLSFRITGDFNVAILQQAFDLVQSRNEVLRSVFSWENLGTPLQVVLKVLPCNIDYQDYTAAHSEDVSRYVSDYREEDRKARFDLQEQALKLSVIKIGQTSYIFIITHHHILYDGWSTGIFLKELFYHYNQLERRIMTPTTPKPFYKAVYTAQKKLSKPIGHEDYWRSYLSGYEKFSFFSIGHTYDAILEPEKIKAYMDVADLDRVALELQITRASIIYACYGLLLQRYHNCEDVVFGTTVSGRSATIAGIETVIGNFINTIPFRIHGYDDYTVGQYLIAVNKVLVDHNGYATTSLADIKRITGVKPDSHLFDTALVIENYPLDAAMITDNGSFNIEVDSVYENTDLPILFSVYFKSGIDIELVYKPYMMDRMAAQRFLNHFIYLIQNVVADLQAKVKTVSILRPDEEQKVLYDFNDTYTDYDRSLTIIDLFRQQVSKDPERIATEVEGVSCSYCMLDQRSDKVANYLRRKHGVGRGDLIGVMLDREEYLIPCLLGILKAGAAYLPIDINLPEQRVLSLLDNAGPKVIIARSENTRSIVDGIGHGYVNLDEVLDEILAEDDHHGAIAKPYAKDLAYVIYTSGSTGKPKGVMIAHDALVNYITWAAKRYLNGGAFVFPLFTSISFDLTVTSIFTPLVTGGKVILYREREDSITLDRVLEENLVNVVKLTPSHLRIIRDKGLVQSFVETSIQKLIVGGEDFPATLAVAVYNMFAGAVEIFNEYGPTETTVGCMIHQFCPADAGSSVPIGIPADNVQIYLLDRFYRPSLPGATGEIFISGEGVACGYRNQPGMTAQAFLANPFVKGCVMYKTGDFARRLSSGILEFLGRADEQVKIRGYRIELSEIEGQILCYPGMLHAKVLAVGRQGDQSLVAYCVAGEAIDKTVLRDWLLGKLPSYMVPSYFIYLDKIPLTTNGKVDRKALPDIGQQGEEDDGILDETEAKVFTIWAEILGHKNIGRTKNFFDVGADSLKLITASSQLSKAFGVKLTVNDLFRYPNIQALVKCIDEYKTPPVAKITVEHMKAAAEETSGTSSDIAIIGMGCRFPGAADAEAFWENLRHGRESVVRRDTSDQGPAVIRAKGVLDGHDYFDEAFFGYVPKDVASMDPQLRVFHECAWEALENAGYNPLHYRGAIGLYAGASPSPYYNIDIYKSHDAEFLEKWAQLTYADKDFLANRVSYALDLKGPSVNVSTACSTSLVAVDLACQALLSNACDMALAGGISITLHDDDGYVYHKGMVMSPDGRCRAFDEAAAGTVGGNGVGIVVLKRLEYALRDGDSIHAVIKATATNNDGSGKVGFSAPGMNGQSRVIATALAKAGIPASEISYVEAHGSGTTLGDPIEVSSLVKAFATDKKQFCAIGSVKTNIGHLDAAAGAAGLIKTVLSLKHKQIPPSLHYTRPNVNIDFGESPFYVNAQLRDWHVNGHTRNAGVSSFGIGGTNAHVVLTESPVQRKSEQDSTYHLLLFSGRSQRALENNIDRYINYFHKDNDEVIDDVAYTLAIGRAHFPYRSIVVCREKKDVTKSLAMPEIRRKAVPVNSDNRALLVFMFPGQGSQYAQMCRGLYGQCTVFSTVMDQCLDIAMDISGHDFRSMILSLDNVSDERLNQTCFTQPALFIVEYALCKQLMHWGLKPDVMIGHSFGEYVAACVSGVFSLRDALFLVIKRGELMQAAPAGSTLAVACTKTDLQSILREYDDDLSLAILNSTELCVVSGKSTSISKLQIHLSQAKIGSSMISAHHAFHSFMMEDILDEFGRQFKDIQFHKPSIPFVSNLTGQWIEAAEVTTVKYWKDHLRNTVLFASGIESIMKKGAAVFVEVGPGIELSTFVRSHHSRNKGHRVVNMVRHPETAGNDLFHLLTGLGKLWQSGIDVDWEHFYEAQYRKRVPLPTYAFDKVRHPVKQHSDAFGDRTIREDLVRTNDITKWFYVPTWKAFPLLSESRALTGLCNVIFADEYGVCQALSERLTASGDTVIVVKRGTSFSGSLADGFHLNPSSADDMGKMFALLANKKMVPNRYIYAWGLNDKGNRQFSTDAFELAADSFFYSLVNLVKAADTTFGIQENQMVLLTNDLQRISGKEEIYPEKSISIGLMKVLAQEYPATITSHIDISLVDAVDVRTLDLLYGELVDRDNGKTVALRNSVRWIQSYEPISPARSSFRQSGVYLITGGLGNFGYHLSKYLLQYFNARLILFGRTELPPSADWPSAITADATPEHIKVRLQRLVDLQGMGGDVLYMSGDASCHQALKTVIEKGVSRFGPIQGVIHAAGTVDGRSINSIRALDRADYRHQFASKIVGLNVLHEVIGEQPLDFCMITSSLSPLLGGLDFAAYASANTYMDYFVSHLHSQSQASPWLCINLDGLNLNQGSGEGITPVELETVLGSVPIQARLPQIIISVADINQRINQWIKRRPNADVTEVVDIQDEPDSTAEPLLPTQKRLKRLWFHFFGLPSIDLDDDFFDLGGDSLKALTLVGRIQKEFGVGISIKEIFNTPTLREQANLIDGLNNHRDLNNPDMNTTYTPIQKAAAKESYVLSSVQKRLYFLHEYDPHSLVYNQPLTVMMEGVVDKDRLANAFRKLIARHESLRTSFDTIDGEPRQIIVDTFEFNLTVYPSVADEKQIIKEFIKPFDLKHAPLMRVGLIYLAPEKFILVVDLHHIITDAISKSIIIKDFMALYNDEDLEPVALQYKDYSEWQNGEAARVEINQHKRFWLEQFSEEPTALDLPTDFSRPQTLSDHHEKVSFRIDTDETNALLAIAETERTTLFTILLSCYYVLLSKLGNQEDIVVGTPISGRHHPDAERVMGMFVNTLPLRNYANGQLTFIEFIRQVAEKSVSCFDHQNYPYEELIEDIGIDRHGNRNPLFDVVFSFRNYEQPKLSIPGLTITPYGEDHVASTYDLTLVALVHDGTILLDLEYSVDLFKSGTAMRFAGYFKLVVAALVDNANVHLSAINMLPAAERDTLLFGFNDTHFQFNDNETIVSSFERQVAKTPDSVAVVFEDESVTYRMLNNSANFIASLISQKLTQDRANVALLFEPSAMHVASVLGVLKAKCAYVPLSANVSARRNRDIVENCEASLLLVQENLVDQTETSYVSPEKVLVVRKTWFNEESANPGHDTSPHDIAYIIYTSGSTGIPKGVKVRHIGIINMVAYYKYLFDVRPQTRMSQVANLGFDAYGFEVWPCLLHGGTLCIAPEQARLDPQWMKEWLAENNIAVTFQPTAFAEYLLQDVTGWAQRGLRIMHVAGDRLNFYPTTTLPFQLNNLYGPTEDSIWTTCATLHHTIPNDHYCIGKPIGNRKIYIIDAYHNLQPLGVPGELCIAGPGLAAGYVNHEALTQSRFVDNPFLPGSKMYKTGDLARWLPDGNIEFLGRIDNQVKIRGFRIELGEIEHHLLQYPGITECAVLAKGGGDKYLVAYYVAMRPLDDVALRDHLKRIIPDYMIPGYYVHLQKMPVTENGKLNRKALPDPEIKLGMNYMPARNSEEAELVKIWAEILFLPAEMISVNTSFFELGGHSLKAVTLANKIFKVLGVKVSIKDIFKLKTVEHIAEQVANEKWVKEGNKHQDSTIEEYIFE